MTRACLALVAIVLMAASRPLEDGVAALRAGRLADAERSLDRAVREQPSSFEANYYLGLARFRLERLPAARESLEKAVRLAPRRAAAWKLLGVVSAAQQDLAGAVEPFGKACDLAPEDEDACYYLGRNLYSLNRFEPARIALEKALATGSDPRLWRVHRALAQNFEALGMAAEAERHFLEAIRLNRNSARPDEDPRIDFGVFLFRQGRAADSMKPLEEAVRTLPHSARAQAECGRVLLQLGRPDEAAARLEQATQLDPKNWAAHLLLGRAYQRLGRAGDADKHLRLGEQGLAAEEYGASAPR